MDLEAIIRTIIDHPYVGAAAVFVMCGLGFPMPEELVLMAAGFVCAKFPDKAQLLPMMGWCASAIAIGDMIPFLLGKIFGVRLLRLRWLRYLITKKRLAIFDHWFRRRGDMVIVISRFMPGLRMVAFFTAGAMKMRWTRFLVLDGLGIVLIVPLMTWLGYSSASFIEEAFQTVRQVERGLLWAVVALILVLVGWIWWWRRRPSRLQQLALTETFVQPRKPVDDAAKASQIDHADPPSDGADASPSSDATGDANPDLDPPGET